MPRISSAFSTAERAGGAPVELYTFQRGTKVWRYTSADSSQTVSGITFTPARIKRAAVEQKKDTPGQEFTVSIPIETPFAQDLIAASGQPVVVTLQRNQASGTPISPVLMGQMTKVKFSEDDAELTVATGERLFQTLIPRTLIQRTCPWALYSTSCGVDKTSFATVATISSITPFNGGYVLTIDVDAPDGYWTNGIVKLDAGGAPLFIATHTGFNLTIWGDQPSELAVAGGVTVYAGCDKNRSTCVSKFNNLDNFGGFPDLPAKDPKLVKLEKTFAKGSV